MKISRFFWLISWPSCHSFHFCSLFFIDSPCVNSMENTSVCYERLSHIPYCLLPYMFTLRPCIAQYIAWCSSFVFVFFIVVFSSIMIKGEKRLNICQGCFFTKRCWDQIRSMKDAPPLLPIWIWPWVLKNTSSNFAAENGRPDLPSAGPKLLSSPRIRTVCTCL